MSSLVWVIYKTCCATVQRRESQWKKISMKLILKVAHIKSMITSEGIKHLGGVKKGEKLHPPRCLLLQSDYSNAETWRKKGGFLGKITGRTGDPGKFGDQQEAELSLKRSTETQQKNTLVVVVVASDSICLHSHGTGCFFGWINTKSAVIFKFVWITGGENLKFCSPSDWTFRHAQLTVTGLLNMLLPSI